MKHLLALAFISTCLFSFGQSNMFWNNYANFNPAMSGFEYKQHANATYVDYWPALSGNYKSVYANYGMRLADKHGVGITYNGDVMHAVRENKVLLNYNYQFILKNAHKVSIGTGLGMGQTTVDYDKLIYGDSIVNPSSAKAFQLNVGLAYNWKNLFVGISATNLTPPEQNLLLSYSSPRTSYCFHAQYVVQIAEKLQLTPRVLYLYEDGFQRFQSNLTLSYLEKFALGISSEGRNNFGVNVGWDIQRKFRIAYSFNQTFSKLNNSVSGGIHEFSLGYLLKN